MASKRKLRENGTVSVRKEFSGKSLTEQSHQDRCNINSIMARARRTGQVPIYSKQATYGDFSSVGDYQECLNKMLEAERDFRKLPAEIRKEFDNDPAKLIEFMADENNLERAREIGLVEPVQEPETTLGDVVDVLKGKYTEALQEGSEGKPEA